ncbi:hypothetical protein GQR58_026847 [Nymphon striatum]|nr:hypothetical protein GQR58_026847 [Nymphon striatum]
MLLSIFCPIFIWGQQSNQIESQYAWFDGLMGVTNSGVYEGEAYYNDFKTTISKTYQDLTLKEILDDLLADTQINYFISWDNRIILTLNNSIYANLPEGFLEPSIEYDLEISEDDDRGAPVFYGTQNNSRRSSAETVRIGKEGASKINKKFTLKGIVTHSRTGLPVPDVAVIEKSLKIGVVTKEDGSYEINLPAGLNVIETSALGLNSKVVNVIIFNDGKLNLSLDEGFEELDEVIVQADATRNVEDVSSGTTRIESERSKNIPMALGERDVLKIATTMPGISTAGEGAAGFNVRGGKTDQNLILLDNAVIYNPTHFFGFFQAFNPFAISSLNVYKGSVPAEYGGRLSSVFEIESKVASVDEFKGEVSIGPVTGNAVVEIPIVKGKAGLLLGARGAYSDWVLKLIDDENSNRSQASFYDFIAKYNHKIRLFDYSNRIVSLQWNRKLGEKTTGSLLVSNSQYASNISYDGSINRNFQQGFTIEESEVKLKFKYLFNEAHKFDYGISTKLYSLDRGEIRPKTNNDIIEPLVLSNEKAIESALFISDNFKVSDKLELDVGLRYAFYAALGPFTERLYQEGVPRTESNQIGEVSYDKNEFFKTYGGPEARLSARYLLSDSLSLKASFNNMNQFIHTLSNNTTVSAVDTWKLSDTHIKPQTANQFSLGIYKNISNYEFSLEGFYKTQNNIVDFKTGADLLLNENIETEVIQGNGKAYGVELLIRKNSGKLNGWLGYTYSRSFFKLDSPFQQEQVNDGEFFPSNFDKPHDLSVVMNYKFTKRLSFSSNFVYQTGRPITFPVGNYEFDGNEFVLYSDRNQFRVPDYYRLDVGLNIEGNHKIKKFAHSFWTISVYNVLGRNNPYSIFFVSQEGEIKAFQSSIFAIPIPSITYSFKF